MFNQVGLPNVQNIASGMIGGFLPQSNQGQRPMNTFDGLGQLLGGGALGNLGNMFGGGLLGSLGTLMAGPLGGVAGMMIGGGLPSMLAQNAQKRIMGNMQGNGMQMAQPHYNAPRNYVNIGMPNTSYGGPQYPSVYQNAQNQFQSIDQGQPMYQKQSNMSDQSFHLQKPMMQGSQLQDNPYGMHAW